MSALVDLNAKWIRGGEVTDLEYTLIMSMKGVGHKTREDAAVELAAMQEVVEAARVIVPDMYRMCELVGMDVDERKHTEQLAAALAKLDGLK